MCDGRDQSRRRRELRLGHVDLGSFFLCVDSGCSRYSVVLDNHEPQRFRIKFHVAADSIEAIASPCLVAGKTIGKELVRRLNYWHSSHARMAELVGKPAHA